MIFSIKKTQLSKVSLLNPICKRKNWFVNCSPEQNKSNINKHLDSIFKSSDVHSKNCMNIILIGNYNTNIGGSRIKTFWEGYRFHSLVET